MFCYVYLTWTGPEIMDVFQFSFIISLHIRPLTIRPLTQSLIIFDPIQVIIVPIPRWPIGMWLFPNCTTYHRNTEWEYYAASDYIGLRYLPSPYLISSWIERIARAHQSGRHDHPGLHDHSGRHDHIDHPDHLVQAVKSKQGYDTGVSPTQHS